MPKTNENSQSPQAVGYHKQMEIEQVDIIVFPDWCGGDYFEQYLDPHSGEKKYFNTFATPELADKWKKRADEISRDERRLLIHIHEEQNTSGRSYLIDYVNFIRKTLIATNQLMEINGYFLDEQLATATKENPIHLSLQPRIVGYGHHRGCCVPEYGRKTTSLLGLDTDLFVEKTELCVGDDLEDRMELFYTANPTIFQHYSDERLNQLRKQKAWDETKTIIDARKYLFVYCTATQVQEAAKAATSIEDFEDKIGGKFKGFDFLQDYLMLCRNNEVNP